MRTVLAALTVVSLLACAPRPVPEEAVAEKPVAEKPSRPLLWKATRGDRAVHLFGSVHVAKPTMYPLDRAVIGAFQAASMLVCELDLNRVDPEQMGRLVQRKGMLPPGETLVDQLSPETAKALKTYLKTREIQYPMIQSARPWLAIMLLTQMEYRRLGFREDLGIDKHFLDRAAKAKKRIVELETVESQLDAFASGSGAVQDLAIRATIEQFDDSDDVMGKLIRHWKSGDAEKLEALIMEPLDDYPKLRPWMEALFDKRNVAMTAKIDKLAREGEPVFVVIGAGHLLGDKGVVKLLEGKGYRIERVKPAAAKAKVPVGG